MGNAFSKDDLKDFALYVFILFVVYCPFVQCSTPDFEVKINHFCRPPPPLQSRGEKVKDLRFEEPNLLILTMRGFPLR